MSWQMHVAATYTRVLRKPRTYGSVRAAAAFLARPKSAPRPPETLSADKRLQLSRTTFGAFHCYTLQPRDQGTPVADSGSIVYLHGGGYVNEIRSAHWNLAADIADACHRPVHLPIYGLAPRHHAVEASGFVQAVIHSAATVGPVYLVGDSSGGGLALAAAQNSMGVVRLALRGITLISPWLDIALRNPDVHVVAPHDPWLSPHGLRYIGQKWVGDLRDDDPRVSPLFGNSAGLPSIDLYVGTRDLFMPDCRLLRDRLDEGALRYHEAPGAIHIYPLLPVPEGRRARLSLLAHMADSFTGD
ncbi:MAG: alpha/beta hydrolase fold domain-containing protein [Mycobacterium sp.]